MTLLSVANLWDNERTIVRQAQVGQWYYAPSDASSGPASASEAPDRRVRAAFLEQLLRGVGNLSVDDDGQAVALRAVRVLGADIVGPLDLDDADIRFPVELVGCTFDPSTPLRITRLRVPHLSLRGSTLPRGLVGRQLYVASDLDLRSLTATRLLNLGAANVAGQLLLDAAQLSDPEVALLLDGSELKQGLAARSLRCTGLFSCVSTIMAHLNLDDAQLGASGRIALSAENAQIKGNLLLRGVAEVHGTVLLKGATVAGSVILDGATIFQEGGVAISLQGCEVSGDLNARSGFLSVGSFEMLDGRITGSLNLNSARLENLGSNCLQLDRSVVGGAWLLRAGFTAVGTVSAIDVRVGSEVALDGADLFAPSATTLNAQRLQAGDFFFRGGARSEGLIDLRGCLLSGNLQLRECSLKAVGAVACDVSGGRVGRTLWLEPTDLEGSVDLRGSAVDTHRGPAVGAVHLDGYKYERLLPEAPTIPVAQRLEWICRDPDGYAPGPYSVYAEVLRKQGDIDAAKKVHIQAQIVRRRQGRAGLRGLGRRFWSRTLQGTVGYGYRPGLALMWLLLTLTLGALAIRRVRGQLEPLTGAPEFNAALYLVDQMVPFVDLGFNKWVASGMAQAITVTVVALGYVFLTALLAALAGVFRRGD